MGLIKRIRKSFLGAEPSAMTVLNAAWRNNELVTLSFVDPSRVLRNMDCKIEALNPSRLLLRLTTPQPSTIFKLEKCRLFFKLPFNVMKDELKIRNAPQQNGFLCNSTLLDCDSDAEGMTSQIWIKTPKSYVRRELRQHTRYKAFSDLISGARMLFVSPVVEGNAGKRDFSANIVNISAGGAKICLDGVDFLDEFAKLDKCQLFLRLDLNIGEDKKLETWLPCHCVGSNYRIPLRRFTLRLEFLSVPPLLSTSNNSEEDFDSLLHKKSGEAPDAEF